MSYILASTTIKSPNDINEKNDTQFSQARMLNGTIARDYFGVNKRVWTMNYKNALKSDYDTVKTIYDNYLSTSTAVSFLSDEANYTITSTNVHVDLQTRGFSVLGTDYLSDYTLILTEA